MGALIAQLFATFLPIYQQLRAEHIAQHGTEPTDADMQAKFEQDVMNVLAEGGSWKASHPPTT